MKKIGYRVYQAFTDDNGNITHKTLIGFTKTIKGAHELHVSYGVLTPVVIEKAYSNIKRS